MVAAGSCVIAEAEAIKWAARHFAATRGTVRPSQLHRAPAISSAIVPAQILIKHSALVLINYFELC
jgi:hypothetical protein